MKPCGMHGRPLNPPASICGPMAEVYTIPRRPIARRVWNTWRPRPRVKTWEWVCENVRDNDGRPFNPDAYPWARGVCEAFDCDHVRTIVLQWATRIGKTFVGEAIDICTWCNYPMPS